LPWSSRPRPKIPFALFAKAFLGLDLYPWQKRILIAMERKRVSALVCNGGGKSNFVIPAAILAFMYNWPAGRVLVTSGSFDQVEDVIWPAIERHAHLPYFKGWKWSSVRIDTPQHGYAKGFSTNDPFKLEGKHQSPSSPLLYIVDEAKALDQEMYDHINRCSPTFYGQFSSACPAQGYFYESFTILRSVFWTIKITSDDCPHVTAEQRAIDSVTLDPKEYAMKHLSEFSDDLSGSAIPLSVLNRALDRQRAMQHHPNRGARCAFCDFALNRAEHVLALRDGNKVSIIAAWRESDTTQARRQFIEHFKRLGLHPSEIFGDAGGPGYVMIKELKDAGWPINEVNNASAAEDQDHFSNRGSEIWLKAAQIIDKGENGQFVIIPDDKKFIEQAANRKYELDAKQRRRIQSKDELKVSPDRADAVFGALVCRPSQWNAQRVAQVHLPKNPFAPGFVRF
jgi:hypothetical protein